MLIPVQQHRRNRVGSLRPSQLMYAYGVGALVDLPQVSVIVGGLEGWEPEHQREIAEERLLAAVRLDLGPQVQSLRTAPWMEETQDPRDTWATIGVPVFPFPRWLRCMKCSLLSPIDAGLFKLHANPFRPEQTRYEHDGCGGDAVSARFVLACGDGHLDEFPWVEFCHLKHPGGACSAPILYFRDLGTGFGADAVVVCATCEATNYLGEALREDKRSLPRCRGRHPHLRSFEPKGCTVPPSAMILGASNQWFPISRTVLSIPSSREPVEQVVAELWPELIDVTSKEILDFALKKQRELTRLRIYNVEDVWKAIESRRSGQSSSAADATDLLSPEWRIFSDPRNAPDTTDFRVSEVSTPSGYEEVIERVVLVERLREVTALCGFTRVDGPDWDPTAPPDVKPAPMTQGKPEWVPTAESRGEGIFIQLREAAVQAWEERVENSNHIHALRAGHERWRKRRNLEPTAGWPGARFILLHSFAHALLNGLALECGYSAASIRERIYSLPNGGSGAAMAGILLYTAAPDSEGTLGGLVAMGAPAALTRLIRQSLGRAHLCASDPLCAEHLPDPHEYSLHGAACHACSFVPETSCQAGNRYLDRSVLVHTMATAGVEFFPDSK